jgi:hypothetical protein
MLRALEKRYSRGSPDISTKTVDKPVGKLLSRRVMQAVQGQVEPDCLNNKQ